MFGDPGPAENRDFHENFDGRKVMSCAVRWTPRALLWPQKHSGNVPGWFLSDFGTSENFRKKITISTPNFDTKVFRHKLFVDGFDKNLQDRKILGVSKMMLSGFAVSCLDLKVCLFKGSFGPFLRWVPGFHISAPSRVGEESASHH